MLKLQEKHINIFIAYSRKDREYLEELLKHLRTLITERPINIWYDAEIIPGEEWEAAIKNNLSKADIILLLISVDSLASEYFCNQEMRKALQRHEQGKAIVIPTILRSCVWDSRKELSGLQALPQDGKAVSLWNDKDSAYTDIVRGVNKRINYVLGTKATTIIGIDTVKQKKEYNAEQSNIDNIFIKNYMFLTGEYKNVKHTESGIWYILEKEGKGNFPNISSVVQVHYQGMLLDGTIFDSTMNRDRVTTFSLKHVIKGWQEALELLKPGGKGKFYMPSTLCYGAKSTTKIPANSILIFDIELLRVM